MAGLFPLLWLQIIKIMLKNINSIKDSISIMLNYLVGDQYHWLRTVEVGSMIT